VGSRGHLCGAFSDVLALFRAGRLPLHEAVTEVVEGLHGLRERLSDPGVVTGRNCKVLARIDAGGRD
jgi:D-xylulose reductase